jgi:hypothetical protein
MLNYSIESIKLRLFSNLPAAGGGFRRGELHDAVSGKISNK